MIANSIVLTILVYIVCICCLVIGVLTGLMSIIHIGQKRSFDETGPHVFACILSWSMLLLIDLLIV